MTGRALPDRREALAALASGALLTLSFPPFHLLVPPFVALVPWLVHLAALPVGAEGRRGALRAGFWLGIVYFGLTLYWLFAALVWYTPIALVGYLLAVVILACMWAGATWVLHRMRTEAGWPLWLALPIAWTATEWIQGHLPDVAFPWLGLGTSLTGFPWLVGAADVVGARGLSFWIALVNGLLAEAWLARRARVRVSTRLAVGLVVALTLPIGYSLLRWFTLETRPAARVAIFQPNIPEHLKLQREAAKDSTRRALENLLVTMPQDEPDLMVWPEVTYPDFLTVSEEWQRWIVEVAAAKEAAVLVGALDFVTRGPREFDYYNAALLYAPDGQVRGTYHKRYLVPVVERVPFFPLEWIRDLRRRWGGREGSGLTRIVGEFLAYFGGFARGDSTPVFAVTGARFGVLICYESIFANWSRRYRDAGADYLVNITNDAWFGRDEPWWSRTAGLVQHPAHLVMRAIENRVGVARSANTGISMILDPRGRVVESTDLFVPAVLTGVVETTDGRTWYTRLGDVVGLLSFVVALGWIAGAWVRRRRRSERSA